MKIDTHVLFLIVVVGVISAGLVGATVMNNDVSMKQETFDGIKVSVPADSDFVKTGDGVYKDSKYGITINTFKNNNSMVNFLKNSKKSKIIPLENQPPQSIAFKSGKTINLLVTNGLEGMSVSSKDGELTSKIANSIIFTNNHKSQKPEGVLIQPQMSFEKDYNLVLLLLADVDTKNFNVGIFQDNTISVVEDYNLEIEQNQGILNVFDNDNDGLDESGNSVSDVDDSNLTSVVSDDSQDSNNESDNELVQAFSNSIDTNAAQNDEASSASADSNPAQPAVSSNPAQPSTVSNNPTSSNNPSSNANPSAPASSSNSNSQPSQSNNQPQKLSLKECKQLISPSLPSGYSFDNRSDDLGDSYKLYVLDDKNMDAGYIVVDAKTGKLLENHIK